MKKWVKNWLNPAEGQARQDFSWVGLTEPGQLDFLFNSSVQGLQVIFKHSTRCGLSSMMLRRFENLWRDQDPETNYYLLDILRNRSLSESLATQAQLRHQSPQALLFRGGRLIGSASHGDISGLHPADFQP